MSATARESLPFAIMPLTFRSSMPMTANLFTSSVVSLCSPSFLMLEMRACRRAIFALALRRLADPLTLRDRDRDRRLSLDLVSFPGVGCVGVT